MNKYLFPLYRALVPKPVRTAILKKSLRKKILGHLSGLSAKTAEQEEIINFLGTNDLAIFPYPFSLEYSPDKVEVYTDPSSGFSYVIFEGKRLYFKKRWSAERIKRAWSELSKEQDHRSPHRYLNDSFDVDTGEVIADIGAAEGNFSLASVEKAAKVYLFERDREWMDALKLTFAPWKEKVEIIDRYAGESDDNIQVRLDSFCDKHPGVSFIKIDVDGAENRVVSGMQGIMESNRPMKIALCTYHKKNDEETYTTLLREHGFSVSPTPGFMINYYDKKIEKPWLRRGLIRAVRK